MTEKKDNKKSNKTLNIIIIGLLVTLFLCVSFGVYYGKSLLNQVERGELDDSDLGINEDVHDELEASKINEIVNIALFGIDGTSDDDAQHSDSTMVATFDPIHKKLKVTSIMRDTYIEIPGYGKDKFTHAFNYGGPQLTIKTINQNFNLNIKDYVSIDFNEMQKVVDCLGGIDIAMSDEEFQSLSNYCAIAEDVENLSNNDPIRLNDDGTYHLNGFQALGYTRIRDIGRSDFDRTERQRKFLSVMFKKISNAGKTQLASIAIKILPSIETSLTDSEIMTLAINILNLGTKNLESERFPLDDYCNDDNAPGSEMYILSYDEEYTAEQFYNYIFNDKKIWEEEGAKVYIPRRYGSTENSETYDEPEPVPDIDNNVDDNINDNLTIPENNTQTPEDNNTNPGDNTTPPEVDDTEKPGDATTPPKGDDTGSPGEGTTPPEGGTENPGDGTTPPGDGTPNPGEGTPPPEDGTTNSGPQDDLSNSESVTTP